MTERAIVGMLLALVCGAFASASLAPGRWPSLFRGIAVADAEVGVLIIQIDPRSQARQADVRPGDVLIRIDEFDIKDIETFAATSKAFKGRIPEAELLVVRNGTPHRIWLQLYSYPISQIWGLKFIPDDIRFARPAIGVEHWSRLGRGFLEVNDISGALDAYLNALHNNPEHIESALQVARLFSRQGQALVGAGELVQGMHAFTDSIKMLQGLFDRQLSDTQLQQIRSDLAMTLLSVRDVRAVLNEGAASAVQDEQPDATRGNDMEYQPKE